MRKFFAIIGILFSCAVIFVGVQFINGNSQFLGRNYVSAPSSAPSVPTFFDAGFATFGGDSYTFINNNAADAARGTHAIADNQVQIFEQLSLSMSYLIQFFGLFMIVLGGMGVCLFGVLCFDKKPVVPATPVLPQTGKEETTKHIEESKKTNEQKKKADETGLKNITQNANNGKFICKVCKAKTSIYYDSCPYCNSEGSLELTKL